MLGSVDLVGINKGTLRYRSKVPRELGMCKYVGWEVEQLEMMSALVVLLCTKCGIQQYVCVILGS